MPELPAEITFGNAAPLSPAAAPPASPKPRGPNTAPPVVYTIHSDRPPQALPLAPTICVHTRTAASDGAAEAALHRPTLRVEFLHQPVPADGLALLSSQQLAEQSGVPGQSPPQSALSQAAVTFVDGVKVHVGGVEVGTVATRRRDLLVVTFVGGVSDAAVEAVMRHVAYRFGQEGIAPVGSRHRRGTRAGKKVQMSFTPQGQGLWTRVAIPVSVVPAASAPSQ